MRAACRRPPRHCRLLPNVAAAASRAPAARECARSPNPNPTPPPYTHTPHTHTRLERLTVTEAQPAPWQRRPLRPLHRQRQLDDCDVVQAALHHAVELIVLQGGGPVVCEPGQQGGASPALTGCVPQGHLAERAGAGIRGGLALERAAVGGGPLQLLANRGRPQACQGRTGGASGCAHAYRGAGRGHGRTDRAPGWGRMSMGG